MYTTQALIQSYNKRELTPDEARIIPIVIEAVTNWIDAQVGTTYLPTEAGVARVFDGTDHEIFIDSLIDLESIKFLDTYGVSERTLYDYEYTTYPRNGKTIRSIAMNSGCGRFGRRVQVTGKWGEVNGTPKDIQLAATILASDWLDSDDKLKSESIEGYSRTFAEQDANPQVQAILDGRRRVAL